MGVSGQKFDLSQMNEYFEQQIPNIRTLSDLALSEADFKILGAKIKSALTFHNGHDSYQDFILCIVVYWVYSLIYWKEEMGIHNDVLDVIEEMPQYRVRHQVESILNAFLNYGIQAYGYQDEDISERTAKIIARHAGIPNDEKYKVFNLIDDYRNQNASVDKMVEDIYAKLPYKSRYIFSLLDQKSRQEIIWEIRIIMAHCSSKAFKREEIIEKHPNTSICLIDYCFFWLEGKVLMEQVK